MNIGRFFNTWNLFSAMFTFGALMQLLQEIHLTKTRQKTELTEGASTEGQMPMDREMQEVGGSVEAK